MSYSQFSSARYNNVGKWHKDWQNEFTSTEIRFDKEYHPEQIKNRYADVVLNDKFILEVQHSTISDKEVYERYHDYKLHNKQIIWLIDGNTVDVILDELTDGTYLIVCKFPWKYRSFAKCYDFILLDIKCKIFKIPVKKIGNTRTINVKEYRNKSVIIEQLKKNPHNLWKQWSDDNAIIPSLRIVQKGAGNGKTYSIWKNIALNENKNLYIIVTKQHTAKEVILQELRDQYDRNEYHMENMEHLDDNEQYGKQYIVKFQHLKSGRKCKVIMGTVDSFIYSLTNASEGGESVFEGRIINIYHNGCNKISNRGEIMYAGNCIKLDNYCELWVDECQDLSEYYYKGICKLIMITKMSGVAIGDKLQSLNYERNFMTALVEDSQTINIVRPTAINNNRRIKVQGMAKKINEIIKFKEYGVPEINLDNNDKLEYIDEPSIVTFKQNRDVDTKNQVGYIVDLIDREVKMNYYNPEDFLILFPILKGNNLAVELESELNNYWLKNIDNRTTFDKYAILHKHEDGKVINTSTSVKATRLMSIIASKGDGRAVTIILNCNERSLLKFSYKKNIVYESLLHVALTRAKRKIYFGLEHNNDNIHYRFVKNTSANDYKPFIHTSYKLDAIIDKLNKEKSFNFLKQYELNNKASKNTSICQSSIVEWGHHCIRYMIYHTYILSKIIYSNQINNCQNSQLEVILRKISNLPIKPMKQKDFFEYINKFKTTKDGRAVRELDCFPLCYYYKQNKQYSKYHRKLINIYKNIQQKIRNDIMSITSFNPLESCVLQYAIDIVSNKAYYTIDPMDMYDIVHSFEKSNYDINSKHIKSLYEETENMKHLIDKFINHVLINKGIDWNIYHTIKYDGKTSDFALHNKFFLIGHNNTTVFHTIFQTDYNTINHRETIIRILLERFLIRNSMGNERNKNNKTRYRGKKITTYLIALKDNTYDIFEYNNDFENKLTPQLKILAKESLAELLGNNNECVFDYCNFVKKNKTWKGFKSPYISIAHDKNFQHNTYIRDFFTELHNECLKGNRLEIKKITDNKILFCEKLNKHILDACNIFYDINTDNGEYNIDDDIEW